MQDSMMTRMGVSLQEVRGDTVLVQGQSNPEFYNVYGIAHGGYLYTLAHMAAQLAGEALLGGLWEVRDAACQYLHPLRLFPAMAECKTVDKNLRGPAFQVTVRDSKGSLCFEMTAVMKPGETPKTAVTPRPKIFSETPLPKNCHEEPQFPCMTSNFSNYFNLYATEKRNNGFVYAADFIERTCDDYGRVHPGVLFTAADCAAGGTLFYIDKRRPITVSGNIHYLQSTVNGPVYAYPQTVRSGKILQFYDVELVDSKNERVAYAQFIIQDMDHD